MDQTLVFFCAVIGFGVLAQWLAWRLRLPSILILLAVGFLFGFFSGDNPNVTGDTITDEVLSQKLLFPLVSMAVGVIMFEGGLSLRFHELKDSGNVVGRLMTIGVAVTWGLTSVAACYLVGMSREVAALTGAILVVTGPTVIAPLLRHVRPHRRVSSIVKWEGIVIDPIGAVLAVLVFDALFVGHKFGVILVLARIVAIGFGLGLSSAFILVQLMSRYWIPDFLHNAVFLSSALVAFAISNTLVPEAGLLTVTVMGIALANQNQVPLRHIVEFKENLRVLLISCLFIVLAARIEVEEILSLGWGGWVFVILLIFVIRPVSVFLSTIGTGLTWQEKTFLGFLAPRGIVAAAVSSVFALEVAAHHVSSELPAGHDKIDTLTFLVIVITVAFYGLTAAPIARWLGLASANPQGLLIAGAAPWVRQLAKLLHEEDFAVILVDTNYRNTAAASMEGVPSHCASIVSDYMEEMDLAGIGRLLAMTPNDDLNTLAAIEFAAIFGRANVFQLSHRQSPFGRRDHGVSPMSGRHLFRQDATYSNLAFRTAAGHTFKKTKMTDEFTFDDFKARYGDDAIVLFVITEAKQLLISTVETPLEPSSGQSVVALVHEVNGRTE